jgi:flagellar biosynthesis protein FlhG
LGESGKKPSVEVIVNHTTHTEEAQDVFNRFSIAVAYFLERSIRLAGDVPDDDNVARAGIEEMPLLVKFPQSPAASAILGIAGKLAA